MSDIKNREIKFRVWNIKNKNFKENSCGTHCYSQYMVDIFTGEVYDAVGCYNSPDDERNLNKVKNYVIQQFTGLQDKNNRDIYEGDILSVQSGENEFDISSVVFKIGAFRLSGLELLMYTKSELKVIGNIFENPELLNK